MGDNVSKNCVGFLKFDKSPLELDQTWIHPELYGIIEKLGEEIISNPHESMLKNSLWYNANL